MTNEPNTNNWEKEFDKKFKFTEALNSDLKTWRFSLNFTMPQMKDYIRNLVSQARHEATAEVYELQKECRERNYFSHRNNLCLCFDPGHLSTLTKLQGDE